MSSKMTFGDLRAGLWHLRRGGVAGFSKWQQRFRAEQAGSVASARGKAQRSAWWRRRPKGLSFEPMRFPERMAPSRDFRAAVILDDFSAMAFGFEWESIAVTPGGWLESLSETPPDLLFVESAWAGNNGAWKFKLVGSNGPSAELRALVQWCRSNGIPAVFWNKEDPPHYADFLETARLFDVVFTSDENRIPHYTRDLGHDRVHVLPFAAQPAIHNPVRPKRGWHQRDIAFAGMYFAHKYPERREQMGYLLGGAAEAGKTMHYGLEIFSRMLGDDSRYQFPEPFSGHVVGQLPYAEMITAYKGYKVFLNANSVVDSPSMCARRIFEISASGTPVLTAPSAAVRVFFPPEEVYVAEGFEETRHTVRALVRNSDLGERSTHLAQRRIWRKHTYAHRVETVLEAAGFQDTAIGHPSASCIVSTNRPQQLEHVFAQFARQTYAEKQLVVVAHGFEWDSSMKTLARKNLLDDVIFLTAPSALALGSCLNLAVEASDGEVLSKMDDDDLYGAHYLEDLLHARMFSKADVVGKGAHYMSLQGPQILLRRFKDSEHRFVSHVMGPTITAGRDVFSQTRFGELTRGEDTDFLKRAVTSGASIYAADRFNFVQVRSGHRHTWKLSDMEALALGDVEIHGDFDNHVFL